MIELAKAKLDPTSVFDAPKDVLECTELSKQEKISILRRWEYDARELMVAEEENMLPELGESTPNLLGQILKALLTLNTEPDFDKGGSTKHGGS